MLKVFLATIRRLARSLAALIGCKAGKDYVLRPWTEEENADFEKFCVSIGEIPTDPEWAAAMEDGEVDFFNNAVFVGVKLHRA